MLVDADGREFHDVEPVRAFPLSAPQCGISLCDPQGHEILYIDDFAALPDDVRTVLEHELQRREFVPEIQRIVRISAHSGPAEWQVETDRGPTTFLLDDEDNVWPLGLDRLLLIDSHGIRYLINDVDRLDAASRRILDRYL